MQAVLASDHRSDAHRARDRYRNPFETLDAFGLHDHMTVVEVWPGSDGWYAEILAPLLKGSGRYVAASYDPETETSFDATPSQQKFLALLDASPDLYDETVVTGISQTTFDLGPPESADLVLFFRLVHVFAKNDALTGLLTAIHKVLKPGGALGIVEHRADPTAPIDPKGLNGYYNEILCIEQCESAGFTLADSFEINANPLDTKDHPKGVWSLPPWMWGGDEDRDKYLAIGESDRMTLRFTKAS